MVLKRLIEKQVALGTIREKPVPNEHIGLTTIAPFMSVPTDDVVFDYIKNTGQETLAPARAQDAESTLRQSDQYLFGQGRASIIDWAHKNKYTASDVMHYYDNLQLAAANVNLNIQLNSPANAAAQFQARLARDDASRKRDLDNRLEWLIMTSMDLGVVTYSDSDIIFSVSWGRPSNQHQEAPASGVWDTGVDHDPIGDIRAMKNFMRDTHGIEITKALASTKAIETMWKSKYFTALLPGFPIVGGTPNVPLNIAYLNPAWDAQAAISIVERATGVTFTIYDGHYWSRPIGSTTLTKNRYTSEKDIIFYPAEGDLGEIDGTALGFAKTLTSPHPEGNWGTGFYEWEQEEVDPWMHVRGSGIKAFPVFPYMKYTYTMRVLT